MADPHTHKQCPDSADAQLSEAVLWIIDTLAQELDAGGAMDRRGLVQALRRKAGYEQADSLYPDGREKLQAELVARLAGRLARV